MDFHSRDLRYFVAVVEEGGFSRAAERLFVSQPVLSRQVAKLERDLRVRLLEREPRHVRPTPAGEVLLEHARRMLADWALRHGEMLRLDSESRSVLLVGQQTGIGRGLVRRLINRLGQSCPGWRIELRQISWEDPSAGVRSGQTDIGFVWLPVVAADDMEHVVVAE